MHITILFPKNNISINAADKQFSVLLMFIGLLLRIHMIWHHLPTFYGFKNDIGLDVTCKFYERQKEPQWSFQYKDAVLTAVGIHIIKMINSHIKIIQSHNLRIFKMGIL